MGQKTGLNMLRKNAVLALGLVLAGALAAAARTTQGSQPSKWNVVVHDDKPLAEWVEALNDSDPEARLKAPRGKGSPPDVVRLPTS